MLPSSFTGNLRTRKRLHREVWPNTMINAQATAQWLVNNALRMLLAQLKARDRTTMTTTSCWSLKRWISPSQTRKVAASAEWQSRKSLLLAKRPERWPRGYPDPQYKHWQRSQRMNERMLKINQASALCRLYFALWQSLILVDTFSVPHTGAYLTRYLPDIQGQINCWETHQFEWDGWQVGLHNMTPPCIKLFIIIHTIIK